jgi:uncharacterized protein (DUF433 family)
VHFGKIWLYNANGPGSIVVHRPQTRRREAMMALSTAAESIPLDTDSDGVVRVSSTRVTLDTIVAAFLGGATAEEIAQQYPSVPLADVYCVIGYYLRRRDEVDAYLRLRRDQAIRVRRDNESNRDALGIRDRLLARCADQRS